MPKKKPFEPATKATVKAGDPKAPWDAEVVASGVVDWVALDHQGRGFYGSTKAEAEKARADYHK